MHVRSRGAVLANGASGLVGASLSWLAYASGVSMSSAESAFFASTLTLSIIVFVSGCALAVADLTEDPRRVRVACVVAAVSAAVMAALLLFVVVWGTLSRQLPPPQGLRAVVQYGCPFVALAVVAANVLTARRRP